MQEYKFYLYKVLLTATFFGKEYLLQDVQYLLKHKWSFAKGKTNVLASL